MIRTLVLSIALMSSLSLGLIEPAWSQSHTGKMDTDGILSPGEIPNPRFNYNNRYPNRYPDRYPDRYPNNYPNAPYDCSASAGNEHLKISTTYNPHGHSVIV
jgi:hypothetical protein